jgi:hypothetical protein
MSDELRGGARRHRSRRPPKLLPVGARNEPRSEEL